MTRGRKPRAIEVQEASGAFAKDPQRRPKNVIKADSANPEPPDLIKNDKTALAVWRETTDILAACNILSRTDSALLTSYCIVYSEWTKCAEYIQKHGHRDPETGKTSPESLAFFKYASEHNKLIGELGLSPSSRARLSVATSEPNDAKQNSDLRSYLKAVKDGG
jgi:P27 family predicted phage terminase small subunit